ncbi:hypothetical protein N9N67_05335 [Bacteriovoracaceae bacterium]|nr:hypothetical protein [Bacteriovoracaceae bacterium]
MKNIIILIVFLLFTTLSVKANVIGISTHPMSERKHAVNTEFSSYMNNGEGLGLNARYNYKASKVLSYDAGIGVSEGERANRLFAGTDYMLFEDYASQPRVSIKSFIETADEFEERHYRLGVAPTLSKGFSFWGKEGFPFVALPVSLDLNDDNDTYETTSALAMGITSFYETKSTLMMNVEANIGLSNSYTSIVAGITLLIE